MACFLAMARGAGAACTTLGGCPDGAWRSCGKSGAILQEKDIITDFSASPFLA
jgi:hypothetical protein